MKKRLVCAVLVSSMVLSSSVVHADSALGYDIASEADELNADFGEGSDETVSAQAIVPVITATGDADTYTENTETVETASENDEVVSSGALSAGVTAYATDTNYTDIVQKDANGVEYTLTVKYDYTFNDETCCQVTNISKDVICDVEIPAKVTVVIDGKSVTLPVRSIGESAFETAKFSSVTLPETIREIKPKAFLNCNNVKTININGKILAESYVQLTDENGELAYDENGNPKYDPEVDSDGNVVYDADGNVKYKTAVVAANVTSKGATIATTIGNNAFQGCTSLESVYISGFQTMGDYLFSGCTSLKNAEFSTDGMYAVKSNKVQATELTMAIGKNAFENCTALTEITIPKNVKTIGAAAFTGCTALTTVNIGPTLTGTMNLDTFAGCTAMKNIYVDEGSTTFSAFDGILYKGSASKPTSLEYIPVCNETKDLTLPATVTNIVQNAAKGVPNLETVRAEATYNANGENTRSLTIGATAFAGCEKLKGVYLSAKATINKSAFLGCTSLTTLSHDFNGGTIGDSAFEGCTALGDLQLYGWSSIGNNAFKGCTSVKSVTALEGIGKMGNNCFEGCTALTKADLSIMGYNVNPSNTKLTFGTYVFKDCTALETADLPVGLLGISTGTFQNCTSLKKATVGDNAGSIGSEAFDNCTSLTEPPSPRYLVRIYANAFRNCTSLADYELTRSVVIIDDAAFTLCPKLVIAAPDGSDAINYAVAKGFGYRLTTDDIKDEEFLVYDESGITGYKGGFHTLTIPDDFFTRHNVASVFGSGKTVWINNPYSGSDCSMKDYLESVYLGPVTEVGKSALSGSSVKNVDLGSAEIIYNTALQGCKSLTTLTIPKSVKAIGTSAFAGCTSLVSVVFNEVDDGAEITLKDPISGKEVTDYKTETKSIFSGCTSLESVTLSEGITSIPESTFSGCTSLKAFISSKACKDIGKSAFKNCTSLETLRFSPLTERIGEVAFENCASLKVVTLQHNTFLEANAFKGCTGIERIIIPQTVNVAISNTPFISTRYATVVCAKNSKGEEYAKAFNDPETYSGSFASDTVAKSYVGQYNYTIEYGDFVDGVDYVTVRGKLTIPDGVTVTRNGTKLKDGDSVLGGDVLVITTDKASSGETKYLYANGTAIAENGVYVVPENEDVVVTMITKIDMYGDVNYDGKLTADDAAKTLQHTLSSMFDEATIKKADVNADNKITAEDAAMILQKVLDSSYVFPVEKK